jgi:hypothetical protein
MANMKITKDSLRFPMPAGGRPRHDLAIELLALGTGDSLTITAKDKKQANRLRQVCARLKNENERFGYCSRWLQSEKLLRIWRTPNEIH